MTGYGGLEPGAHQAVRMFGQRRLIAAFGVPEQASGLAGLAAYAPQDAAQGDSGRECLGVFRTERAPAASADFLHLVAQRRQLLGSKSPVPPRDGVVDVPAQMPRVILVKEAGVRGGARTPDGGDGLRVLARQPPAAAHNVAGSQH